MIGDDFRILGSVIYEDYSSNEMCLNFITSTNFSPGSENEEKIKNERDYP